MSLAPCAGLDYATAKDEVSITISRRMMKLTIHQDPTLRRDGRLINVPLHRRHDDPHRAAETIAGCHDAAVVHPAGAVSGRCCRNGHAAFRQGGDQQPV